MEPGEWNRTTAESSVFDRKFSRRRQRGRVKLPIQLSCNAQRFFRVILLLGASGACLSGCFGNYAGLIPADWNISTPPDTRPTANSVTPTGATSSPPVSAPSSYPLPPELAAVLANPSAFSVPGRSIGGLQRQADCSLAYFDFSYEPSPANFNLTPNSRIAHYE